MASNKRLLFPGLFSALVLVLGPACGTDLGGFTGVRSNNICDGSYPICNTAGGCVLTESEFLEGTLPGERKFIFRTPGPAQVRVLLLFTQELSAGNSTQIEWNELGCGSQQIYSTMGRDVFQIAGDQQQLSAQKTLQTAGDHLIRLTSDAIARYQLRTQIVP